MKTTLVTALSAVALIETLAGTARAQPQAAPPPPPPPAAPAPVDRTEAQYPQDPSDVSQINGYPVPVGEHNDYHYTFRKTNISVSPFFALGVYGASMSYALGPNVAVRVEGDYIDPPSSDNGSLFDEEGAELDLDLPIYFRRTYQGFFAEPGLMTRATRHHAYNELTYSYDGPARTEHTTGPQLLLGWQWMWDSGLNLAFASGFGRDWGDSKGSDDTGIFYNGYVRLGYAF
jgi:hypothetical protein